MQFRELSWWYWLATVGFLGAGLSGNQWGLITAIGLCCWQVVHYTWRTASLVSFPVQLRVAYLGLLLLGLWGPLSWIHIVQFVGTSAVVLFNYCFLARNLALLPWNRNQPLSWALVRRTIFLPPMRGSILKQTIVPTPEQRCSMILVKESQLNQEGPASKFNAV